jgi:hypothetical protein
MADKTIRQDDPKTIPFSKIQSQKLPPGALQLDATGENFQDVGVVPPSIQGEESISGSEPSPDSDDDTLNNAQEVGEQLGETTENPESVDIARDVDEAEDADARG